MTSIENEIDNRRLNNFYKGTESFKAAFDYFAARVKNSKKTTVDRLQKKLKAEGHDISRGEIIELFKALESSHCGNFIVGRKGHPSRFEWSVGMIAVGQAATGEEVEVQKLSPLEIESEGSEDDVEEEGIEHRFFLRPGFEVQLRLPQDLSEAEASRLGTFIGALPFRA